MNEYPRRLIYIIVSDTSIFVIKLPKHQLVATTRIRLFEIIFIQNDKLFSYPPSSTFFESDNFVYYEPTLDHRQQKREHEMVLQNDENCIHSYWQEKATITDK